MNLEELQWEGLTLPGPGRQPVRSLEPLERTWVWSLGLEAVQIGEESLLYRHISHPSLSEISFSIRFLTFIGVGRPTDRVVSSKGRHLKSFLYPPHSTFRRSHW